MRQPACTHVCAQRAAYARVMHSPPSAAIGPTISCHHTRTRTRIRASHAVRTLESLAKTRGKCSGLTADSTKIMVMMSSDPSGMGRGSALVRSWTNAFARVSPSS